ncbi:NAD(P)-binding protein [Hortaea werneckii]|uniref:NAD(P)-binding protein n=1 Tax=Hortaea werneckii TaxID=91943 RepID=A0A3M7HRF2_HORWE|nr:NAD(P)-binding protein [Hortaea werneckii]KAI7273671.1 NAD(P)-binding protein [Hortaea werneckii]KAI7416582.1 NAD(P)-binding protein [Hortaea werneckii]KAI7433430.1 NAD(P)-binding protein [Hortaea werneckii]KAI7448258.1 NAD(P)-binding protein [Hortaea werneckii]
MQPWAFVSPSSRGIGLELARRLLQTTKVPVVATARKDLEQTREHALQGLKDVNEDRLHVLKVDVLDEDSIQAAASEAANLFPKKESYLHLSLCIPGLLFPEKSPAQINYDDALLTFRTNTLGPMMLLKHFSPFLPRKSTELVKTEGLPDRATWATMSARVGSITDNGLGGWYSYRASKAAVNQLAKSFDNYLRASAGEKAMSISMHPGTVKTGLSKDFWNNVKEEKLFSPEFASEKLMEVINSRTMNDRGKCWDWKGEEVPP